MRVEDDRQPEAAVNYPPVELSRREQSLAFLLREQVTLSRGVLSAAFIHAGVSQGWIA